MVGTALSAAANLASARESDAQEEAWRYSQSVSAVISASAAEPFSALNMASVFLVAATWAGAAVRRNRLGVVIDPPALAPVVDLVGTSIGVALVSHQIRKIDADQRVLEQQARDHAATSAAEAERARQHRLLHDTVLQTLEGVAGDWQAGDEQLRQLAAADAARLRSAIAGDDAPDRLALDVADLARLYTGLGLDVSLDLTALARSPGPATTEALTAATREALQNVLKHARPCTVRVVAETDQDSVTVTVRDDGAGFDRAGVPDGFGLGQSIRARMAAVAGTAEVESEPGLGTTVRLRAPLT